MMPRLTLYTNGPLLNRHVTPCTASRRLSPERISPGSTSEPMTRVAGLRGAAAGRSPPDGPRTARRHIGLVGMCVPRSRYRGGCAGSNVDNRVPLMDGSPGARARHPRSGSGEGKPKRPNNSALLSTDPRSSVTSSTTSWNRRSLRRNTTSMRSSMVCSHVYAYTWTG